jgi:hypothetical protein
VACFDAKGLTRTDYGDARLRFGHLCMAAFSYVAYHEAVDGRGDIDGAWGGYVGLGATIEELRQAAAAWREVIKAGLYAVYQAGQERGEGGGSG